VAESGDSIPISGRSEAGCCARAAMGHVATAPPSNDMNARRALMSQMAVKSGHGRRTTALTS